ncbi:TPA: hypothetical protein HH296_04930 [Xanthomonas vasicola pv. zeae]|uniref:hypothetical protein n=1 Tax=Xanthomonas vasicola TaxID=56459 RepID=UPI0013C2B345|nr:hypothetical protein [Xanthomonas vasicola]HHZ21869.1 hypothetical protein [Xanthomonas vasicola pv. zeae]HHZ25561.1 hypothetical protein [Xanthomonas vasicola pv. zeae]HHZ33920.1 hypothetical protein [Xanthomonas vasicola pv. zeae]HHZ37731.1 hypothetical protein [Xanthomonas vasicola pv. zeae]HHZ42021.1 hypothetical protein [Xanthomonas vasicola pv. zeae]
MDSVFPSRNAHWYSSPQGIRRMMTILLITSLLTALLVVLAYRTSFAFLLDLAQFAAIVCAVLCFAIVSMLLSLIAGAMIIWKKLRSEGKHTAELKELRRAIFNATAMTLLMFMLAVAATCIPLVMDIMKKFPEFGLVFAFMPFVLLLHRININCACSRLTDSIAAAQRAAQRTMAA